MRCYDLKSALQRPDQVTELYLNGNDWVEIPTVIWDFTALEVLDLSNNRIEELSENIGRLIHLRVLNFSQNQLQTLPPSLNTLGELQKLNLSNNRLVKFPKVLAQLQGVKELFLAKNQLKSLDFSGAYPQLQVLNAVGNKIQSLRWEKCSFPQLDKLELAKNKLKVILLGESLPSLRYLNLAYNKLEQLPPILFASTYLQTLLAAKNKLVQIPEEVKNWQWLRQLDLSDNQLTKLPEAIFYCARIELLNLSQNQLTELPLLPKSLRSLQLNGNLLTQLPASIASLNSLTELKLSNNHLVELPQELSHLPSLESLSIPGGIPPEYLLLLDHLKKIQGWRDVSARQNMLQILQLAVKFRLPTTTRSAFFNLLETANLQALHSVPLVDVLQSIGSGSLMLRTLLIRYLKKSGKEFIDLDPSSDVIAILGKTKLARKKWKNRLVAQNINAVFELTADATHVVLGKGEYLAAEIGLINLEKIVWLEEQQLLQWLERVEKLFLMQPNKEVEVEALKRLLLHQDPINITIAANTLLNNGVPQAILPYVLIAYKWLPTTTQVRKTLRQLLETYWPIPFAIVSRKKISLSRNQEVSAFQQNMEQLLAGTNLAVPNLAAEGLI